MPRRSRLNMAGDVEQVEQQEISFQKVANLRTPLAHHLAVYAAPRAHPQLGAFLESF